MCPSSSAVGWARLSDERIIPILNTWSMGRIKDFPAAQVLKNGLKSRLDITWCREYRTPREKYREDAR